MARRTSPAGTPPVPPARKLEMRSAARELVSHGRWLRDNRIADDFVGRVARAMENAYRQGVKDADLLREGRFPSLDTTAPLDLQLISKHSLEAFASVARDVFGGLGKDPLRSEPAGYLGFVPADPPLQPEDRWVLVLREPPVIGIPPRKLSRKAVGPWRTHGLVEGPKASGNLGFSRRAFVTWTAYLDANPSYVALYSRF